jgi:hypothetical protein
MPHFDILKVKDEADKIFKTKPGLFDIPFKIAIIGKSQISLGKSSLILNLLLRDKYYKNDFRKGEDIYIVTNNKIDNKLKILQEEKDIPDSNIMKYDEDIIDALYDILEDDYLLNENKSRKLIIFDDVAFSGKLKDKQAGVLSRIVMNGRHINLSSIFTTQKASLISTSIRSQLTGAMIGSVSNKELGLIEQDFNFLESGRSNDFFRLFRKATGGGPRDFIVINFTEPGIYFNKNFEPLLKDKDKEDKDKEKE